MDIIIQISIYGHSLGSVLSYDILCHQHNLSSPFPMDAVYKKFFPDEESPPVQASADEPCSSHQSSKIEPEISNQLNNTEEITGEDNDMMDKKTTLLEHQDVFQEGPSLVSDSVVDIVGLGKRESQEDDHHDDSSSAISSQDGPDGVDCRTYDSSSPGQSWEKKCENSKNEEMIKLLQEEVNTITSNFQIFSPLIKFYSLGSCKLSAFVFTASHTSLGFCSVEVFLQFVC